MHVALFNAGLIALDLGLLFLVRRRGDFGFAAGLGIYAAAAPALAVALSVVSRIPLTVLPYVSGFAVLGMLAWGVFLHLPLVLLASAALLRRERKVLARAAALGAVAVWLVGIDAFLIEPTWLELSRHRIETPELTRPVRIVVLADLQTDRVGEWERSVLRAAAAERPDLVLLPGDYVQEERPERATAELERLAAAVRESGLRPPLGMYAVAGNIDLPGWERGFAGTGAVCTAVDREYAVGELRLTALSLGASFDAELALAPEDGFHVVVGHAPDFALGTVSADLLIAGHTHGGQVRLPLLGPPITLSRVPRAWSAGRTELAGGRTLIVSRGIGLERGYAPRLRFLCRPELVVIDLVPAGAQPPPSRAR